MKKVIALLLCVLMLIGLLTGCSKEEKPTDDSATIDNTTTQTTENEVDNEGAEENTETDELTELTLPLSEEKVNISVWTFFNNNYVDDPSELLGVQKMEEVTNVHVNWNVVATQEVSEKFGLMLASGDIPDLVYAANITSYPGGLEKAIDDGVFMDVTDVVAKYMPNYRELRLADETLKKDTMTDSGRLAAVYGLNSNDTEIMGEKEFTGLGIRQDMLDKLGLDVPVTIDDWHEVLTAAKDAGADAPLLIGANGYSMTAPFITAFGVLPEFYQVDGVIKYGPAEEGYRQWIELFRQWYAEGLIDPNFVSTNAIAMGDFTYTVTDRSIAYPTIFTWTDDGYVANGFTTNQDIRVTAVANPVLNEGDTPLATTCASGAHGWPIYFSANCENVEIVAKWLDFQYTTEGMLLNFYGVEGETYTVEGDKYVYTDTVLNNEEGYTPSDALSLYARGNGIGRYNWAFQNGLQENFERFIVAEDIWTDQDFSYDLSNQISMTEEEGIAYNSLYTAIITLVNEMTVKYIMGVESMDTYDQFVENLYNYGLEECIGYKQAALDRYNNRK